LATEIFSNNALDAVATNGFNTSFLGNGHAQTMLLNIIGPCQDPEIFVK
jgi:hypothetical protein